MNKSEKEILVDLQNVSAAYGRKVVLDGVNLSLGRKDFLGIAGPNGGGKTTLLKVILGIIRPAAGRMDFPAGRPVMGYLPQQSTFSHHFPISAREVVLSGLLGRCNVWFSYSKADKARAMLMLERMGMKEKALSPIGELSGGERQRVLLARALMSEPQMLLLDEPTTYFDYPTRRWMLDELKRQRQERTIVMVSHDLGDLLETADTIAYVNCGLRQFSTAGITLQGLQQALTEGSE